MGETDTSDLEQRFAALYAAHRSSILRYLRRRLGDEPAEDAAAEVFLRAYRRIHTLHSAPGEARPWLYGIAEYVVLERRRAEQRRLRLLERIAVEAGTAPSEPSARARVLSPHIVSALHDLSAGDRSALLLAVWGELSYEEVAAALEIPVGTVRSRIARARRQLRPVIETPATSGGQHE